MNKIWCYSWEGRSRVRALAPPPGLPGLREVTHYIIVTIAMGHLSARESEVGGGLPKSLNLGIER